MKLTTVQQIKLPALIERQYKFVLKEPEFSLAFQVGRLSSDDFTRVYQKTLRAIENKQHLSSFEGFAVTVATKESRRYLRAVLAKERERHEKHLPLNDTTLQRSRAQLGPIPVDPATLVEERDLHDKVRSLIAQLPSAEAALVRRWMDSRHGDNAIEVVARQLKISHATAYNLFRSARDRLRMWLAGNGHEPMRPRP